MMAVCRCAKGRAARPGGSVKQARQAEYRRGRCVRLCAAIAWLAIAATIDSGIDAKAADADAYPRAVAAASALHFAQTISDALKTPTATVLVHSLGGATAEAWTAWAAGNLFSAVGAMAAADDEWQHVAEIARANGNADEFAGALAQRVEIALSEGDYARCQTLAEQLALVADASGNRIQSAFAEANLGVLERRRGHLDGALSHQEHALELYRSAADPYGIAQSLTNLATVYRDRGDFAKALDMALASVALQHPDLAAARAIHACCRDRGLTAADTPRFAAFANGLAIHVEDFDDTLPLRRRQAGMR